MEFAMCANASAEPAWQQMNYSTDYSPRAIRKTGPAYHGPVELVGSQPFTIE
jgi:hypothetical protein